MNWYVQSSHQIPRRFRGNPPSTAIYHCCLASPRMPYYLGALAVLSPIFSWLLAIGTGGIRAVVVSWFSYCCDLKDVA